MRYYVVGTDGETTEQEAKHALGRVTPPSHIWTGSKQGPWACLPAEGPFLERPPAACGAEDIEAHVLMDSMEYPSLKAMVRDENICDECRQAVIDRHNLPVAV